MLLNHENPKALGFYHQIEIIPPIKVGKKNQMSSFTHPSTKQLLIEYLIRGKDRK